MPSGSSSVESRSDFLVLSGSDFEDGRLLDFFEFRHLTFQEYLAAEAMVKGWYPGRKEGDTLVDVLEPHFADERWGEVIPLAATLGGRATEELIRRLTTRVGSIESASAVQAPVRYSSTGVPEAHSIVLLGQCLADEAGAHPDSVRAAVREFVRLRLSALEWPFLPVIGRGRYARFERYRLAGPRRSLLALLNGERQVNGAKKARSVPESWALRAKQWRWRERAEAWDAFERQQARAAHAEQVKEMNLRHVQEARAFQSMGIQHLKSIQPDELTSAEALRFCMEAAKLERTAMGEPEMIAEQRLTGEDGGAVVFTVEDAVEADQELERWHHDQVQRSGSKTLPE